MSLVIQALAGDHSLRIATVSLALVFYLWQFLVEGLLVAQNKRVITLPIRVLVLSFLKDIYSFLTTNGLNQVGVCSDPQKIFILIYWSPFVLPNTKAYP